MNGILEYEFIRNALWAGILAGLACGVVGSIVVSKRIVSLCGGISHASFGGVGLGYLLNINPSWGALLFGVLSGLGIGIISKKAKQHEDTAIGVFWALGMSLGVIFIALSKGYAPDLFTYLFGNILAVTRQDLVWLFGLDVIIALVMVFFYKEILAVCFDEEFAGVRGIAVGPFYLSLLVLAALTVVVLMKIVGIILMIALLTIPAAVAGKFVSSLRGMMALAVLLNLLFIGTGFIISYYWDLPSGATIILVASAVFLLAHSLRAVSRKVKLRLSSSQSPGVGGL